MKTLWIHRQLLNWQSVYAYAAMAGIKKLIAPDSLHCTLATVRVPVDWTDLEPRMDTLVIPRGEKPIQIFGFIAKGIAFDSPQIITRHAELAFMYPEMDHPARLRPHVTIYRGGKMPKVPFEDELIFGAEIISEFSETNARLIPHLKVADAVLV